MAEYLDISATPKDACLSFTHGPQEAHHHLSRTFNPAFNAPAERITAVEILHPVKVQSLLCNCCFVISLAVPDCDKYEKIMSPLRPSQEKEITHLRGEEGGKQKERSE